MATETAHTVRVHCALDKIIALHPILMRGAVGEMSEGLLPRLVLFQLPEILEIHSDLEAHRPVVILAIDGVTQRLPLRVTLYADVGRLHCIEPGRVGDVQAGRSQYVRAPWSVALFA